MDYYLNDQYNTPYQLYFFPFYIKYNIYNFNSTINKFSPDKYNSTCTFMDILLYIYKKYPSLGFKTKFAPMFFFSILT